MPSISVNFKNTVAPIKAMNAVNNGPVKPGRSQLRDNFETYKALKIPYARTHDASICYLYGAEHCVDVPGIFPDFDADVNDPANYDFLLTDQYLQTMIAAGTEPYYRLGSRIEHWDKKYNTLPPKDFKKWAEICEHIIAHYTEGWADGFKWNIKYWEIWNEPEVEEGQDPKTKNTWGGTTEEFYRFYAISAKHLKNRFPHLMIGGPALCWLHSWGRDFVKYMKEHDAPIDFYSWHFYSCKIFKLREDALNVRGYLDEFGFYDTESHLNEWNYVKSWQKGFVDTLLSIKSQIGSAFLIAVMTESQHLPIDMLMYYDARVESGFNGLFDVLTLRPQVPYYSMLAFSKLAELGTECESRSDDDSIYTLAAANEDGKAGLISYYTHEDDPEEKTVVLDLGCNDDFTFYAVNDDSWGEKIDVEVKDGKAELNIKPFTVIYYHNGKSTEDRIK